MKQTCVLCIFIYILVSTSCITDSTILNNDGQLCRHIDKNYASDAKGKEYEVHQSPIVFFTVKLIAKRLNLRMRNLCKHCIISSFQ